MKDLEQGEFSKSQPEPKIQEVFQDMNDLIRSLLPDGWIYFLALNNRSETVVTTFPDDRSLISPNPTE